MTAARRICRAKLAAALTVTLFCSVAAGQVQNQGGPIVVGATEAPPLFHVDMPTGDFNFDYLYEHDTNREPGTPTTGTTDNRALETLDLQDTGYILSPNLVDIKFGGLFGLQQETFDEPGTQHDTDGTVYGWDVSGTFLRDEIAPLTLYTRRSEQWLTPNFSPSLDSIQTTYGGSLAIHSDSLPTQVQVYQEEDSQTQFGGITNYTLTQDVAHWHTDATNLHNQTLSWDFNYQNTNEVENESPSFQFQNYNASLNDVLYFGPKNVDSLSSSLSALDQTGDIAFNQFRLNETLRLQHSSTFSTHYDYTLDQSNISGVSELSNELDLGFVHHLFQSLTTTGDIGGSLVDETGGSEIEQLFARLGFDYRKIVPYGLLTANLNFGWQWLYSPSGTGVIPVINLAQSFTNNQPIVLTQPDIIPTSIKVLSSGGVPYLNGTDFQVHTVGNLIQVQRLVGGLIPNDGNVLIDYDLAAQPANTTNTGAFGIGGRYEFDKGPLKGFAPYLRYSLQDQTIDTEDASLFIPNSYSDIVAGADYRIWKFTFNVEQDWHDSTVVPFDASRASARFDQRLGRDIDASLFGSIASINYYGEHDNVDDANISASIQQKISSEWSTIARVIWMNDRDELFGNTEGLEEQVELRWKHNQTEVFSRVRNATLQTNGVESTFQVLEIGLTRRF